MLANRMVFDVVNARDIENSATSDPTFDSSHQAGVTKQSIDDVASRTMETFRVGGAQCGQESHYIYPA